MKTTLEPMETNATTYTLADLPTMLEEMSSYLSENLEDNYLQEFAKGLFQQLTETGLFHDACGKVIEVGKHYVKVSIDY